MSAWDKLLAASSLAIGTAWQLISSPRTGGTGATIYIEQIKTTVADETVLSAVTDDVATSMPPDDTITSTVTVFDAVTSISDNIISVEVTND